MIEDKVITINDKEYKESELSPTIKIKSKRNK